MAGEVEDLDCSRSNLSVAPLSGFDRLTNEMSNTS